MRLANLRDCYGHYTAPNTFTIAKGFSWRFTRSVLLHELTHKLCFYHTDRFYQRLRYLARKLKDA